MRGLCRLLPKTILMFFIAATLIAGSLPALAQSSQNARSLKAIQGFNGKKVSSVAIKSDQPVPDIIKNKLTSLKGKRVNLGVLRELTKWFHESLDESRMEIRARNVRQGVHLELSIVARKKVREIIVSGNTHFERSEILTIGGIRETDKIDISVQRNIERSVSDRYRAAGYLRVKVGVSESNNGVLRISIQESELALIEDVTISDLPEVKDLRLRNLLRERALDAFGMEKGDPLDREKVKEGLFKLRNWLRENSFLVAKDPIVNSVVLNGGRSAHLDVKINYGPRMKFGFRNNKRFSYKELLSFVEDIEEVGVGSDYLSAIKEGIKEEYDKVGLVGTKIQVEVSERPNKGIRQISLIIKEGTRYRIDNIKFGGVYALDQDGAAGIFLEGSSRLVRRYIFQDRGIRNGGEQVAERLRSMGYLSAKLDLVRYIFEKKFKKMKVELFFSEGVQTRVSTISLIGLKNLSSDEVKEILHLKEGTPFNIFSFEKGIGELKDRYLKLGYLAMEINNLESDNVVQYSKDQSSVDVVVEINEGPLIRVGDIIVRGNKKTHARVITRELPFIEGDILTSELRVEAEENLRRLNLFSSIILRPIERPSTPEIRDILILVEEGVPGLIEFGPGYRNDLGLRFFVGASYQNLGGWHRGITARAVVNRRLNTDDFKFLEYNLNLGFREPYFLGWRVTLFTNFILLKRQFSSFDANINKVTVELRKEVSKYVTGLLQYSFERVKTFNAKKLEDVVNTNIGAITPGLIFDSRDDKFNPTKGLYSVNRFEIASTIFGSQNNVGYHRITSNNSVFWGLAKDVILSMAVRFGFERSNIEGEEIPKIKLFRLGGTSSIRGYREDSLEVESKRDVSGTLTLLNYRMELRFPLEGQFGLAVFWDAGNLYVDKVQFLKLRHSIGIGLRYNTAVGPVSLDYARKLGNIGDRGDSVTVADSDNQRIHFSIGTF